MAASCYGGVVCLCVAGRGWQPAVMVVWSVFVLLVGDGSQLGLCHIHWVAVMYKTCLSYSNGIGRQFTFCNNSLLIY